MEQRACGCSTHTAKRSVVLFSSATVQEMFLQEPQHTWGSVDGSYTWCCTQREGQLGDDDGEENAGMRGKTIIPVHIFGNSWQRKRPWQRSPSLDLCDGGSGQCSTVPLPGTEPETGPGPAGLPLGTDTPLLSLHKQANDIFLHFKMLFYFC